jgi:hypothetical protein
LAAEFAHNFPGFTWFPGFTPEVIIVEALRASISIYNNHECIPGMPHGGIHGTKLTDWNNPPTGGLNVIRHGPNPWIRVTPGATTPTGLNDWTFVKALRASIFCIYMLFYHKSPSDFLA